MKAHTALRSTIARSGGSAVVSRCGVQTADAVRRVIVPALVLVSLFTSFSAATAAVPGRVGPSTAWMYARTDTAWMYAFTNRTAWMYAAVAHRGTGYLRDRIAA